MVNRQALGHHVTIGELYDIRTDCFCNKNVLSSVPSSAAVKTEDIQLFEFRRLKSNTILKTLSMFGVETEQQLSVVSGLCEPKGLASLLIDKATETAPSKAARGILCTYKKKKEKLCLNGSCRVSMTKNVLTATDQATHVFEEVTYGANTFLYLEFRGKNASAAKLKNLLKIVEEYIQGRQYGMYQDDINFLNKKCKIQVFSDTLASTGLHMQTVQHALDYLKSVPTLLESIVVPLSFTLIPISRLISLRKADPNANQKLFTKPNYMVRQVSKHLEETIALRQKVTMYCDVLERCSFCTSEEDLRSILALRTCVETDYVAFRKELTTLLVEVRCGRKHPDMLQFCAEERQCAANRIEQMLALLNDAFDKAELVNQMLKMGICYVDKAVSMEKLLSKCRRKKIHVLHHCTKARKTNPAQWMNYRKEFLKTASYRSTICVLFDHDFDGSEDANEVGIDHYRNGWLITAAVGNKVPEVMCHAESKECDSKVPEVLCHAESKECDSKVPEILCHAESKECASKVPEVLCYAESKEVGPATAVPKMRAYLRLPCPGASFSLADKSQCDCAPKTWHCRNCQGVFMYGFDEAFHCSCGSAPCWSFRFMCNDENHGTEYLPAPWPCSDLFSRSRFAHNLSALSPLQELNILLLGETGVGKSTWINSFMNYLTYETMEEAERSGLKYLMRDQKHQPGKKKMGKARNANNSKGQSTTEMPISYVFTAGELMVRLIDTPGVGDSRGIEQDKVNFQNILSHLTTLEHIHGICILLKPGSTRMITLQFCITELLAHLHQDACKKIVFIFTNSCETFYWHYSAFSTLHDLLEKKNIKLSKETIYSMDNEAVRLLATIKQGMAIRPKDKFAYSICWKKSVSENERLVQHILSLTSHSARRTLSLNKARHLILGLTEPLVQISQNIQNNIILAKDRFKEVNAMFKETMDLKDKLSIPVLDIEPKPVHYPRIVCTSSKCTESISIEGLTKINYKTLCHEHCSLKSIQVQQHPCSELQNCLAVEKADSCTVCGCTWEAHINLTYECLEVMKTVVDMNVENLLNEEWDSSSAVEAFIKDVEQHIASLEREQEIIIKVASKCSNFLKQNAIVPCNDTVDEYLQKCIRMHNALVCSGVSDETLKGLENVLASYRQEVSLIEVSGRERIDTVDISRLIEELFSLPINGKTLKEFVDVALNAKKSMAVHQEKVLDPPSCQDITGFLRRAWCKARNALGPKAL